MGPFASGIGLVILVLVLLFTWLTVATFVSPELAAFMGLLVVGLWFLVFVPLGFIRELIWRSRQKQIMASAMNAQPSPYQAGTALPPPSVMGGAVGGSAAGSLMVMEQPNNSGAIDLYRELPQLPQLEPRPHASAFKRSLVLPFVGLFMFIGANNDTVIHGLLEARGLTQQLPVEWDKTRLPPEYADYQSDMNEAVRLTLRREPFCGRVLSGRLAAQQQFTPADTQKEQIANGDFVFEIDCAGIGEKPQAYLAWVTEAELDRSSFSTLLLALASPPSVEMARTHCEKAAAEALAPMHASARSILAPTVLPGRMPWPDHARLFGNYQLTRESGGGGMIGLSCWAGRDGRASVRFSHPN